MTTKLTECTLDDLHELQTISIVTFTETFKDQNSPEHLKAYLDEAYDLDKLKKELKNPSSRFYFIYVDQQVAGYLKLNTDAAQTEPMGADSLEVERIYVKKAFQRYGLGKQLLNKAFEMAVEQNKKRICANRNPFFLYGR